MSLLPVLHDEKRDALLLADVIERADVGMIELRDDARFPMEALAELRVGGELVGLDFDRDNPIQPRIARAIDLAHAAGGVKTLDPIRAEGSPGLERVPGRYEPCRGGGGPGLALASVFVMREQRRDVATQFVVALAGAAHESIALGRIALQRLLKDLVNVVQPVHCRLSWRRSARGEAMPARSSNPE